MGVTVKRKGAERKNRHRLLMTTHNERRVAKAMLRHDLMRLKAEAEARINAAKDVVKSYEDGENKFNISQEQYDNYCEMLREVEANAKTE